MWLWDMAICILPCVGCNQVWEDYTGGMIMKHEKEIDKFVKDVIIPKAKDIIEQKGMEHIPIFFIKMKGEKTYCLGAVIFDSQEDKIRTAEKLREICKEQNAEYFIFVSEAWQIKRKEIIPDEKPSEAKDRQEILNIIANNRVGESVAFTCKIKRDGDKRSLGKPEKLKGMSGGIFHIEW